MRGRVAGGWGGGCGWGAGGAAGLGCGAGGWGALGAWCAGAAPRSPAACSASSLPCCRLGGTKPTHPPLTHLPLTPPHPHTHPPSPTLPPSRLCRRDCAAVRPACARWGALRDAHPRRRGSPPHLLPARALGRGVRRRLFAGRPTAAHRLGRRHRAVSEQGGGLGGGGGVWHGGLGRAGGLGVQGGVLAAQDCWGGGVACQRWRALGRAEPPRPALVPLTAACLLVCSFAALFACRLWGLELGCANLVAYRAHNYPGERVRARAHAGVLRRAHSGGRTHAPPTQRPPTHNTHPPPHPPNPPPPRHSVGRVVVPYLRTLLCQRWRGPRRAPLVHRAHPPAALVCG